MPKLLEEIARETDGKIVNETVVIRTHIEVSLLCSLFVVKVYPNDPDKSETLIFEHFDETVIFCNWCKKHVKGF